MKNTQKPHGWQVVGFASVVIGASLLYVAIRYGWTDDGLKGAIRVTARTSFALFLAAFAASSLATLVPSKGTRWLLTNRRYLGISFAISHIIHGAAIITLALRTGGGSLTARVIGLSGAGVLYLFIFFMLVTSFDKPAAWVGPKVWKRVHTIGSWLVFLTFFATYGRMASDSRAYLLQVVLLIAVFVLRIARRVSSRATPAGESPSP